MRGLSYEDAPSGGKNSQDVLLAPLMMSGLLRRLEKLTVRNIMRGRFESHEFLIFDVHAWREHTLSESECIQWTVTIMLTEEHFPTLHIEPVVPAFSLLHPDRQSVKTQDEEFDRRFMVFGERSPVEHLLHQNLRNYLLGLTYTPERWYRHLYLHDNMIFLIEGTLAPPRHIEDMIRIIIGVRNHITVSADY